MLHGRVGVFYIARFLGRDLSIVGRMGDLFKQLRVHEGEFEEEEDELKYFLKDNNSCLELLTRKLKIWVKRHGEFATVENLSEVLRGVDLLVTRGKLVTKFSLKVVIEWEAIGTAKRCIGHTTPVEVSFEDFNILQEFLMKPKAVSLAVAVMKHKIRQNLETGETYDVEEFMRDFEDKFYLNSSGTSATKVVWEVVVEKMATKESKLTEGDLAVRLLDFLPFFPTEGSHVDDLWELIGPIKLEADKEICYAAFRLLQSMGIVMFNNNKVRVLNLSRILMQLGSKGRVREIISKLGKGLEEALKQRKVGESLLLDTIFAWNKMKDHKNHLEVADEFLRIPALISQLMYRHGMYVELISHTQECVDLFYELKVPEFNKDFLIMRRWQGHALDINGRYAEAADILLPVYLTLESEFGINCPATLNTANDYVSALFNLRKFIPARQLIREILFKKENGNSPNEVVEALCTMQVLYGRILVVTMTNDPAIDLMKEALVKLLSIVGEDHLRTIESLELIAISYSAYGHYDSALKILEEVLKQKSNPEILGEIHPETLKTKLYLGLINALLMKVLEAMEYLNEVHSVVAKIFGTSHEYYIVAHQLMMLCLKPLRDRDLHNAAFNLHVRRRSRGSSTSSTGSSGSSFDDSDSPDSVVSAFGSFWSDRPKLVEGSYIPDGNKGYLEVKQGALERAKPYKETHKGNVQQSRCEETAGKSVVSYYVESMVIEETILGTVDVSSALEDGEDISGDAKDGKMDDGEDDDDSDF